MEIIIKTAAYATNKNVAAIVDGLRNQGFEADVRTWPEDGVAIVTNAPKSALDQITFTRSAARFIGA